MRGTEGKKVRKKIQIFNMTETLLCLPNKLYLLIEDPLRDGVGEDNRNQENDSI